MKISSFICLNRPFVKAIGHAEIKKKNPPKIFFLCKSQLTEEISFSFDMPTKGSDSVERFGIERIVLISILLDEMQT